jgi:hypothetical protein
MFKEERDQSQFEWSMLGDLKAGRPNLGPMTHVAVYRLMQKERSQNGVSPPASALALPYRPTSRRSSHLRYPLCATLPISPRQTRTGHQSP